LIIHCTAGKDRTGVICALILSLCGVPDDIIAYEYSLTEEGLAEFRETLIAHLLAHPALEKNEKGALNMISAR
jgi:protein tyrosine/serine phosphatase